MEHYGSPTPPRVFEGFEEVRVPIDICAGAKDGVVPAKCVYQQYQELSEKLGRLVTYREFPTFGHLNFIHQPTEEFTAYLLSRLALP